MQLTHDPRNSSDETKLALIHLKNALLVVVSMMFLLGVLLVIVTFFGYGVE